MRHLLVLAMTLVLTIFSGAAAAQEAAPSPQKEKPAKATLSVNINTATATELETLPGIGLATAARIIEYRQKNGPFKKIEDLMNVKGIGEKTFLNLKPMIVVTTAKGTWL